MATDNIRLKALILEAMDACRVKIDAFAAVLSKDNPGLLALRKDTSAVFEKFKIEGIWANPIPFDEAKLLQQIVLIRTSAGDDFAGFSKLAKELTGYLETEVLKTPLQWLIDASTSDWNLKMLDALRNIRSTITKKKNSMAEAGTDPLQNAAFKAEDELFNEQVEVYRTKLKDNEVETDENKLKTMKDLASLINLSETVADFTGNYELLNEFIGIEIGVS